MLKKIALAGVLAMGMMITGQAKIAPTTYLGNGTPAYFDYNTNFPQMYSRMGMAKYMDRTSAVVLEDNGNDVVMAVNSFFVSKADTSYPKIYNYITQKFYYDRKKGKVYVSNDSSDYSYIDPDGSAAVTRGAMETAEALYYIMTGRKFYGGMYYGLDFYNRL